jgi:hypothetical protein
VEALCAIGLTTEPGEPAFLLIQRAITKALFELVGESADLLVGDAKGATTEILDQLDFTAAFGGVHIDRRFLDRPSGVPLSDVQNLLRSWLEVNGVGSSTSLCNRRPASKLLRLRPESRVAAQREVLSSAG